ncbi:SERK1 [Artemisia annua]|uniref:SERK1 n=1 Tax=Artemisia annua TaxID=35608 RepID=A0A2U1QAA4_ARTAN|nr:SERK1 [Artemisia annua]
MRELTLNKLDITYMGRMYKECLDETLCNLMQWMMPSWIVQYITNWCDEPARHTPTSYWYPYMPNGSLASCLKVTTRDPLNWPQRKQIAFGFARRLAHLYNLGPRKIIHTDVKAVNILLTHQFEAVLSDFGCTKDLNFEDSHVTCYNC